MADSLTWRILVETFGPSGVILGLGMVTLWRVLPWLKVYLETQSAAMERIANAQEQMLPILRTLERRSDDAAKDMIGIYALANKAPPSATARRGTGKRPSGGA